MENEKQQFNARLPRETVNAMKAVAAMLDVSVQQLAEDAIAVYYGRADAETSERRDRAVIVADRLFGSRTKPAKRKGKGGHGSVKEPRLPLRQSPEVEKISAKSVFVEVDKMERELIIPLPGVQFFRAPNQTKIPIAA